MHKKTYIVGFWKGASRVFQIPNPTEPENPEELGKALLLIMNIFVLNYLIHHSCNIYISYFLGTIGNTLITKTNHLTFFNIVIDQFTLIKSSKNIW